jgi:hypothetical protein
MREILRPDQVISYGSNVVGLTPWTGSFTSINEAIPNDATYILGGSSGEELRIGLAATSLTQFGSDVGVVRWRAAKISGGVIGGGGNLNLTTSVYNVRNGSTISFGGSTMGGWQTFEQQFSISALYRSNWQLGLTFRPTTTDGTTTAVLSWAELELPRPRRVTLIL